MIEALWQGCGPAAKVWLRKTWSAHRVDHTEKVADLTVDEAIRLRDNLTKVIGYCIDSHRRAATAALSVAEAQRDREREIARRKHADAKA